MSPKLRERQEARPAVVWTMYKNEAFLHEGYCRFWRLAQDSFEQGCRHKIKSVYGAVKSHLLIMTAYNLDDFSQSE